MKSENTVLEGLERDKWRRLTALVQESDPATLDYLKSFQRLIWHRFLLRNSLVFFIQYTGLFFSTLTGPSFAWFASGTACGFLFLRGKNVLPGLSLGSFAAYYAAGLDWTRALACALVLIAQTLLLVKLNYRSSILSLVFFERSAVLKFMAHSAIATAGGSILLAYLCLPVLQHPSSFIELSLQWWLANLNGTLIFASALYTWDAFFPDLLQLMKINKLKLLLSFALFFFLVLGLLSTSLPSESLFFFALSWISLLWISRCYHCCGVSAALFFLALILQCALFFNLTALPLQQNNSPLMMEFFLLFCSITSMVLAI